MRKKIGLVVALVSLMLLLVAVPALAAQNVGLMVNGDKVLQFDLIVQDGTTMAPVDAFARFSGADVDWDYENDLAVMENGVILSMTLGENDAYLKGKKITMPGKPVKFGDQVYLPLRFVAESLGFDVDWDQAQKTAILDRNETRDELTPNEMLVKVRKAVMDANTYSGDGTMKLTFDVEAGGKKLREQPPQFDVNIKAQLQNEPMRTYVEQKITSPGSDQEVPGLNPESKVYITEEKMYVKTPDQDHWTVMDNPVGGVFWEEQRDIQSDPLKALAEILEWGIMLNYGNDTSIGTSNYYVINATVDTKNFMNGYQTLMRDAAHSVFLSADLEKTDEVQKQIQNMLDNSKRDFVMTVYVNKANMFPDVVKMNLSWDANISAAEYSALSNLGQSVQLPENVSLKINMQGDFKNSGLGDNFRAPDVSNAKPANN